MDAVGDVAGVVGLAHLSGGGARNLLRLSRSSRFVLDGWPEAPPLFRWLQRLGGISEKEMFRTFNMGVGFVLAVRPRQVHRVLHGLSAAGAPDAFLLGHVAYGTGVELPAQGLRFTTYP